METGSTPSTSCRSALNTPSARKRSCKAKKSATNRRVHQWQTDAEYIEAQDRDSTWSTFDHGWGDAAATKFVSFGHLLEKDGRLCHDDTVADFGGNDGWASFCFYSSHKIKPLVIDCEPKRLNYAKEFYKLPTYLAFIENMPELADKSIDWGFTSHTMEHMREPEKALREMARVIKRGCCFIVPLENLNHARKNHAHAICFTRMSDWTKLLESNGWKVIVNERAHKFEAHFIAEPK